MVRTEKENPRIGNMEGPLASPAPGLVDNGAMQYFYGKGFRRDGESDGAPQKRISDVKLVPSDVAGALLLVSFSRLGERARHW